MPKPDRNDVVDAMASMDICFMVTKDGEGLCSRPMSNNAQVDWDGSNWFFSNGDTRKIRQLEADPATQLDFSGDDQWISLRGKSVLHRDDKALFEEHWSEDIEEWFPRGIKTEGLVLIEVQADSAELFGAAGEGIVDLA